MSKWKVPLLANFGLLILISAVGLFYQYPYVDVMSEYVLIGISMVVLAPMNLVVGLVRRRKKKEGWENYIILSCFLLLIGFSTCSITILKGLQN